jgi:hypothetical protein
MSTLQHEILTKKEQAKAFAVQHAAELAQETLDWHDSGLLRDGHLRELAKLLDYAADESMSLGLAEGLVDRMIKELFIASANRQ